VHGAAARNLATHLDGSELECAHAAYEIGFLGLGQQVGAIEEAGRRTGVHASA
jgi:hypothetical protein